MHLHATSNGGVMFPSPLSDVQLQQRFGSNPSARRGLGDTANAP
jgi:hypothetical protein